MRVGELIKPKSSVQECLGIAVVLREPWVEPWSPGRLVSEIMWLKTGKTQTAYVDGMTLAGSENG